LFGFAIGRFDIRPALQDRDFGDRSSAFDPFPSVGFLLRSSSWSRRLTAGVGSIISVSRRITSCGYSRSNASQPACRDENIVTLPAGKRRMSWST
jgi:hypothetical protein